MKWVLQLKVFFLSLIVCGMPVYAEMIEVPREELEEYLARMEADRIAIEQLTISNLQLQQQVADLQRLKQNLESQMNVLSQNKVFLGGNIGYPFINIDCVLLYQFGRNGIYILGGYNRGFNINVGFLRRL